MVDDGERSRLLQLAIDFIRGKRTKSELDAEGLSLEKIAEGEEAKAMLLSEIAELGEEDEAEDSL